MVMEAVEEAFAQSKEWYRTSSLREAMTGTRDGKVKVRITKVICPHCEGDPDYVPPLCIFDSCNWCGGDLKLPVSMALQYATNLTVFGYGQYIESDISLAEYREMEAKAKQIRLLCGNPK